MDKHPSDTPTCFRLPEPYEVGCLWPAPIRFFKQNQIYYRTENPKGKNAPPSIVFNSVFFLVGDNLG